MIKINVKDFVDILGNQEVKQKLSDLFSDSIQVTVTLALDKLATLLVSKGDFDHVTNNLTIQIDELNTQVASLRLKIQSKEAVIDNLKQENLAMRAEITTFIKNNDELQQEMKQDNLVLSGFTPTFTEATAGGTDRQHFSLDATIVKVASFCHQQLFLPDINEGDISSANFLPPKKSENHNTSQRLLVVRFQCRSVHDKIFYSRCQLKNYNHDNNTHFYINEDLMDFHRKLFAVTCQAVKDGKIDSAWTSDGTIHAKTGAGRIVNIRTREDLRLL